MPEEDPAIGTDRHVSGVAETSIKASRPICKPGCCERAASTVALDRRLRASQLKHDSVLVKVEVAL